MFDVVTEAFFGSGSVIRSLPIEKKVLYLTFDDGPDPVSTEQVLKVLEEVSVLATFFVVGTNVKKNPEVFKKILINGHHIGNHSYDHAYSALFLKDKGIKDWILRGEEFLQQESERATVGFRPPNGVLTPSILRVAKDLDIPIYLWSYRFFDTLRVWSSVSALKALQRLKSGDILLLHDRQSKKRCPLFLQTLQQFILNGQASGWTFLPLPYKTETMPKEHL